MSAIKDLIGKPAKHRISIDGHWLTDEEVDDLIIVLQGEQGEKKSESAKSRAALARLLREKGNPRTQGEELRASFEHYFQQQGKSPEEAREMARNAAENRRDSGVRI